MMIEFNQKFSTKPILVNSEHICSIEKSINDDECIVKLHGNIVIHAEIDYDEIKKKLYAFGFKLIDFT